MANLLTDALVGCLCLGSPFIIVKINPDCSETRTPIANKIELLLTVPNSVISNTLQLVNQQPSSWTNIFNWLFRDKENKLLHPFHVAPLAVSTQVTNLFEGKTLGDTASSVIHRYCSENCTVPRTG
jgi:hypothetical protein